MTPTDHPLQDGSFDPLALLRRGRGDGDDLREIKLRLLWLRQREPDARVRTRLVTLDERAVVLSARIALPGGGEGCGHAARRIDETSDIAELIETTELRAIGRALDVIGYVVTGQAGDQHPPPQARDERSVEPEPDASVTGPAAELPDLPPDETPRRPPPEHIQAIRALRERDQQAAASTTEQPPAAEPEAGSPAPTPIDRRQERRSAAQAPPVASAADDDEPELEDVSWTAFWTWARKAYQIGSRVQVEELLGQPVARKTPGELRQLLTAHFEGQEPGST